MSEAVDRALSENNALISSILHHNAAGRHFAAVQLLEKVQRNLQFIAGVADHGIPVHPTPLPSNITITQPQLRPSHQAASHEIQQIEIANRPQHLQQHQHQHQHQHQTSLPPPQNQSPVTTTTTNTNTNNNKNYPNTNIVLSSSSFPNCNTNTTTTTIAPNPLSQPLNTGELQHGQQVASSFWTPEELARYEHAIAMYGNSGNNGRPDFKAIALYVGSRTSAQVRNYYNEASNNNKPNNDNSNNNESNDGKDIKNRSDDAHQEQQLQQPQQQPPQPNTASTHYDNVHDMPPTSAGDATVGSIQQQHNPAHPPTSQTQPNRTA